MLSDFRLQLSLHLLAIVDWLEKREAGEFLEVIRHRRRGGGSCSCILAGNHEFIVGPGTPTIIATDALLFKVKVQDDVIAMREFEGMFAHIQVIRSEVESVSAEQGLAYRQ